MDKLQQVIGGKSVLVHSLLAFERCEAVDELILVARVDQQEKLKTEASTNQIRKLTRIIPGGAERQDSVWCGLENLSAQSEIVLIHDAARPCISSEVITRCVQTARDQGAAIPAVRVRDTIKRVSKDLQIRETLDRSELWAAQTPQTFRVELIRRAYKEVIDHKLMVTDDAAAVERLGHPVWIVESDPLNMKITIPEDFMLAEIIFSNRQ